MDAATFTSIFETARRELTAYVTRLVARPAIAEEIVQSTYVKAYEALAGCPDDPVKARAWLFRIATNTGIDELRRHSAWRESAMQDLRAQAESDPAFVEASRGMIGTPETSAIAKEHLAACFACTLRSFPHHKAAALLLREVYGFSVDEIAEWLGASASRVKNWLQDTRAAIDARYGSTCALVAKRGVCHQCAELADFFGSGDRNPLARDSSVDARLAVLRQLGERPSGVWHRLLLGRLDDL